MGKRRAFGADAALVAAFESTYGTVPAAGSYYRLPFKETDLGAEQDLGYDPLLGEGAEDQDPYYEDVKDEGSIDIPLDTQALGFYLKGLFGDPVTATVKAKGSIDFQSNPSDTDTITLNGTVWTFVAGTPTGNQTQIQGTATQTVDQLVTDLNASADAEVAKCTYSRPTSTQKLDVEYDTAGTGGNSYTLAASAATPSGATLLGGGYSHAFTSGGDLPSMTIEVGHPKLTNPKFYRNFGAKLGSIAFNLARTGLATATVNVVAQGETEATTTIDGAPSTFTGDHFSNSKGAITKDGSSLGSVIGAALTFSNNLEPDETIRDDGLVDGVDETNRGCTGSLEVRFGPDTGIDTAALGKTPVDIQYGFSHPKGWSLDFHLPRVTFPRRKKPVRGPGGINASYDFRASKDDTAGYLLRVTLVNDVATY